MKIIIMLSVLLTLSSVHANEWKFVTSEDSINVYTKDPKNGVMPFKASAYIAGNIDELLIVLKDHQNKNKWAPKLEKVKLHQKISEQEFIFSEYYKTPWPATDREFLLKGTINKMGPKIVELKAHSVDSEDKYKDLASDDHIQAQVDYINIKLRQIEQNKTEIEFEFHGDMKGWMPVWLMNLIQKKWPLRFIQGLRRYSANPQFTQKK